MVLSRAGRVVVGDVGQVVHAEPDLHDQLDHADHVQVDAPEGEKTVKITQTVGDEDERDNGHDEDAEENSLDGMREDFSELVEEGE